MQKEMKDAQNLYIECQVHLAINTQAHLKEAGQLLPAPSSRGEHGAAGPLPGRIPAHLSSGHTCTHAFILPLPVGLIDPFPFISSSKKLWLVAKSQ